MSKKLKRKRSPVLIDSGPLLLLLVGMHDENMIERFKRVRSYDRTDFNLLVQFLIRRRVLITPGVLSEVSNMAMELRREEFKKLIETNIEELKRMNEFYVTKDILLQAPEFKRVGATDTSLLIAAKEKSAEILTADHPLHSRCRTMGIPSTHMMELEWRAEQFL